MERFDRLLAVSFFALLGIACLQGPYRFIRSGEVGTHAGMFWGFGLLGIALVALSIYCLFCRQAPRFQLLGAKGPSRAGTLVLAFMVLFMFIAVLLSLFR
jgi:hypothetical protein